MLEHENGALPTVAYIKGVKMTREEEFKPLPSDLIQDPQFWPEWRLTSNYEVVKRKEMHDRNDRKLHTTNKKEIRNIKG